MKGKVVFILTGVVSLHLVLLGGVCLSGGCKSWWGEKSPETTPPPAPVPGKPVASELPPFQPTPAPKGDFPQFQLKDKTSGVGHAVESGSAAKYTVKNGDSLWKVAKKHGISMSSLAKANNIPVDKGLKIGQTLNIPAGGKVIAEEKAVSTKTAKAATSGKKAAVTKSTLTATEPAAKSSKKAASSTADSSDSGTYIVKAGDTLAKIASKNHIKLDTLAKANNIDSKKQLKVGQKIVLPKSGTSVTAPESEKAKEKAANKEKKDKSKKDAKGLAAKADKTDKAADASATTEKTGSKVDSKAQEALKKLNEGTTETPDDSLEDMDKEAAKSATKADAPKAEAKPAAGGSAPETVDISEETTIQAVAARYGVKVDDLKKANPGLPSNGKLIPGMIIVLP